MTPDPDLTYDRGAHVCHLYESFDQLKEVALPFIKGGLAKGEYCLYVINESAEDEWYMELQAFGIDVQAQRRKGALDVISREQWRRPGRFDSISQAREALNLISTKLAEFPAVRIAGDVEWELGAPLDVDQLCHWEATANLVFEDLDVRAMCQYNLSTYSRAAIHAALRTHPVVLYEGRNCPNPFYEAPKILEHEPALNHCCSSELLLNLMLNSFSPGKHRSPARI